MEIVKRASKDLAEILAKRNAEGKYNAIIERAANNGWHDFKYEKIPGHPEYGECLCPKTLLVHELSKFPELVDVLKDVANGMYDDPADEEDVCEMRNWLIDDDAADHMFTVLNFKIPTAQEREGRKKLAQRKTYN